METTAFNVVRNDLDQYSVWPAWRALPAGRMNPLAASTVKAGSWGARTVEKIVRIQETAAAARLTRAKRTLALARGEFRVPDGQQRRARLPVGSPLGLTAFAPALDRWARHLRRPRGDSTIV